MNDDHHELFALIVMALLVSALAIAALVAGNGMERPGIGIITSNAARGS